MIKKGSIGWEVLIVAKIELDKTANGTKRDI